MEVEEFVAKTLAQIVRGVIAAQKEVNGTTAGVSPASDVVGISNGQTRDDHTRTWPERVEFDIAVTVSSESGTNAKLNVSVLGVGAKAGGESGNAKESVSRIRFGVPVALPHHPDKEREMRSERT